MLLFELFAPFIAFLSLIVAVALFVVDRRARNDPSYQDDPRPPRRPVSTEPGAPERGGRRPSMSP